MISEGGQMVDFQPVTAWHLELGGVARVSMGSEVDIVPNVRGLRVGDHEQNHGTGAVDVTNHLHYVIRHSFWHRDIDQIGARPPILLIYGQYIGKIDPVGLQPTDYSLAGSWFNNLKGGIKFGAVAVANLIVSQLARERGRIHRVPGDHGTGGIDDFLEGKIAYRARLLEP